jgi:hypothetical protein
VFQRPPRPSQRRPKSCDIKGLQIIPIQHASLILKAGGKVMCRSGAGATATAAGRLHPDHGHSWRPYGARRGETEEASTVIVTPKAAADKFPGAIVMANGGPKPSANLEWHRPDALKPAPDGQTYRDSGSRQRLHRDLRREALLLAGDTEAFRDAR